MMKFFNLFFITAFNLVLSNACCSWDYDKNDFEFSDEELNHLGPYKIGDTIFFESNLGDMDTITIVNIYEERIKGSKCFISRGPSNYKAIIIKHLPNNNLNTIKEEKVDKAYQDIISITKLPLQKKIYYSISFKKFITTDDTILGEYHKEYILNNIIINDCYKIKHGFSERITTPVYIEFLYWTDNQGLTAYENNRGETWFIKNKIKH